MKTDRLIWNMTWRGSFWGSLAGALLGGSYVALCTLILFLVLRFPVSTSAPTSSPAFQIGVSIAVLLISLLGAVINGVLGLVLGLVGGALCGLMTQFFFHPLHEARAFRLVVGVTSALYGLIGTLLGIVGVFVIFALLTHPATSTATRTGMASNMAFLLIGIYLVPPLVGLMVAILIGQGLAGWYRRTTGTLAVDESRATIGGSLVPSGAN
jgi:hypothetical protein